MSKTCPDCSTALESIQIFDRGFLDGEHDGFGYALGGARRTLFKGPQHAGTVQGWLCPDCSRVLLYAQPKGESSGAS